MKTLLLRLIYWLIFPCLLLTACGPEDDTPPPPRKLMHKQVGQEACADAGVSPDGQGCL